MTSLDTSFILGLLVVIIVGFFAYQWMIRRSTTVLRPSTKPSDPSPGGKAVAQAVVAEQITGQTAQETAGKEPLQRTEQGQQQPIQTSSFPNASPAQFTQNLRHPEQAFHQPSGLAANPQFPQTSDIASGRAGLQAQVGPGQQGFSPEMAQNGGLLMGHSVMAFDSMTMDPMGGGLTAF
jgi:hypothetical protein